MKMRLVGMLALFTIIAAGCDGGSSGGTVAGTNVRGTSKTCLERS